MQEEAKPAGSETINPAAASKNGDLSLTKDATSKTEKSQADLCLVTCDIQLGQVKQVIKEDQCSQLEQTIESESTSVPVLSLPPPPTGLWLEVPQVKTPLPSPPAAWSDKTIGLGYTTERVQGKQDGGRSDAFNSVLVDMGKVVGVLRQGNHQRDHEGLNGELSEDNFEDSASDEDDDCEKCPTCLLEAQEATDGDVEDPLCGDPLVYATFVAPIQQYSTETGNYAIVI